MANLPRPRAHPKLLWVFGLVFCALLLPAFTQVAADSQEDSDLVFDHFDLPDLRTHRTARESDGYTYEESSQSSGEDEEEQHWLSRTVNRIKRSIGNIFSPEQKHHKGHERLVKGHQKSEDTGALHPNLIRNSRQSNFDINDEDEEEGQIEDDYDTTNGQYEDKIDEFDDPFGEFDGIGALNLSHANRLDEGPGLDDEDGLGSGMDGSGEISTPGLFPLESTGPPVQADAHPKYYRITVTVEEYYTDNFHDRISEAFQQLASKIEAGVQELFQSKSGEQIATVISIERKKDDPFNVRATIDLESKGWTDNDAIKNFIYDEIQDNRKLGEVTVSPEDFVFTSFEEQQPKCEESQVMCHSRQCVGGDARCNGIRDCNDNSDEEGCPSTTTTPAREPAVETVTVALTTSSILTTIPTTTTTTSTTTTTTPTPEFGSGDGEEPEGPVRADDVFSCEHGDGKYYGDQKCDGTRDCKDGSDEANCFAPKCAQGEFGCDLYRCLPMSSRCDGLSDCEDETDEQECYSCTGDAFHCDNSKCIQSERVCDGDPDCRDGSDEICKGSESHGCLPTEFDCGDGQCIPNYLRCSEKPECSNGEDERNCHRDALEIAFRCSSGEWIRMDQRCDRLYDCPDQSDEKNCPCLDQDFHCDNGFCIPHEQRCDGIRQCQDSSDERNCEKSNRCERYQWQCRDGACIDQIERCNRKVDCADGSDEANCTFCNQESFRCNNGTCVTLSQRCNGIGDCPNSEDEEHCDPSTTPEPLPMPEEHCLPGEIRCRNGICTTAVRCDRQYDCADGTDEEGCEYCPIGEFRCLSGICVDERLRCDGLRDCLDGSDEEDCGCQPGQFDCQDGECVSMIQRCDGQYDCPNGIDESECPEAGSQNQTKQCGENEFNCGDGHCISMDFRCDGPADCPFNKADEENCECQPSQFRCSDGHCISSSELCNQVWDCLDGSDEANCSRSVCASNDFRCESDNTCLPNNQRCDRIRQCSDGSDEEGCDCYSHEFQCSNGQCVDNRLRCNGRPDCSDYSDESNCITTTQEPITLPPVTVSPRSCPFGYVSCLSEDQCVLRSQLCDGRVNCPDASDESNCAAGADGLQLRTYPSQQNIKENQEVVFQCRDEGPIRARVEWKRANGAPLPPGSRDKNGRLEMPNIKMEHGGTYVCVAKDFPLGTPGAEISVQLHVEKVPEIYIPPPVHCYINESTCSNGDCIPRNKVCDGHFDCSDGSDEIRCRQCEPNEFKCDNKKCVSVVWKCDGQDDCDDGSDERFCQASGPDGQCGAQQFTCRNRQCVPRTFHCDGAPDCMDKSDEIGCTAPVVAQGPPGMITLAAGQTFVITCRAVGVPTPQIMWRLNWNHVPPKCRMTSENGFGTLTCENIQIEDQGAYSCEALSAIKTVLASPDTILTVTRQAFCPAGYFNVDARVENECIKCFCFGHSSSCRSADLFIFQFQPPFDTLKLLGARIDPRTGVVQIRDEPIYKGAEPQLWNIGANGVATSLPKYAELNQPDVIPYFALPENYHGNQLKSYGGYLKYTVRHANTGRPVEGPDVILTGNNYVLLHESRDPPAPFQATEKRVRFFDGDWTIKSPNQRPRPASREEVMMALEDVSQILIKLAYSSDGLLNTTLTNIEMDSAAVPDSGLGVANYVEECSCPVGYTGTSCENCAEGYVRHKSGQWLGQCYREPQTCPPGSYFDGRECQVCPCPYTSPSNQFARTCHLNTDGNVVCDCQPGYVGLRCEHCAPGFTGNPLQPGDTCRPASQCDPQGTLGQDADGRCLCKEYSAGPFCNQCKPNTFYLSNRNQFGCIACFCMGVSQQCSSSSWYRDTLGSVFTSSTNDFRLTDIAKENAFSDGIQLNQDGRELLYSSFGRPEVYYWSLPNKYLGDKVTSYGGFLRYTIRNTPVPGGASSRNNAPDVELVSENNINLQYFSTNISQSTNAPQTFVVPLLEQFWQRNDGQKTDREHLLMALADVQAIYIKATYFTNTQEAALISVSLDTATDQNTGRERAFEVEQCHCPPGYTGLSCEDCAFGYTRAGEGIYLELCIPCECNGLSNECDPETGDCRNCRNNTGGSQCEQCLPGFTGDPTRGQQCAPHGPPLPCNCDPRGTANNGCVQGSCQCKSNVEGPSCDRCRNGTFGLSAQTIEGCEFCFCSGVSTECSESHLYLEQIPVQITEEHNFILTDEQFKVTITEGFKIDLALNEIGYTFPPSRREKMYWSLPSIFTGNQIKSYGGKLEYMYRYFQLPYARYIQDKDIIITGNGVVIYWARTDDLQPTIINSVSVRLHPSANWYRIDERGPRRASREDILTVLANIDTILIRATPSTDTSSTFLSDISLDTAVDVYTAKPYAASVENCRCPPGYRGTSCESCASGYYKDLSYSNTHPLGTCRLCPCNGKEESCHLDHNPGDVVCNCLPGYSGRYCDETEILTTTRRPSYTDPTPVPPTIDVVISGRNIEIFQIGSSVTLNCSAISRIISTAVQIDWSKHSDRLPFNAIDDGHGLLYIRNLSATDSGRYVCRADDGYSVVTESINIVVGEDSRTSAPVISLAPPFVQASEGQLIEVRCSAAGNPLPEFYLSRTDRQPLNPTHLFENGVFRILQARVSDAGQYQCTAVNRAGQDSKSFEIQVNAGSVLQVDIRPNRFEGRAGDRVELTCIAGRAQNIRWTKEGEPMPYQSRDEDGVLIIPSAQPSDSGTYICTATSYDGTRGTQFASVTIQGGRGQAATARAVPEQINIRQGETAEVRCEASGTPTPVVKWTRMRNPMGQNAEQIGNNLRITNARVEDRGVYICAASNELGLEQAAAHIEVTRFEAPLVQILPDGGLVSVRSGNSVQLQCRVIGGYPSPTVTWRREAGLELSPNVELLAGGNLRITDVTPAEAGQYICSATNDAGTAEAIAHITVNTEPTLSVTPDQESLIKAVNDDLQLICYASGYPQPTVSWVKATSSEYYSSARGQGQLSPAYLEFTSLRQEDAGIYVCIGQNEAGIAERRVRVDILPERGDNPGGDTSSSPSNVEEFNAIAGAMAELRCNVTSSGDVNYHVEWVRAGNQPMPPDTDTRHGILIIHNVQPSAAGEYECVTYQLPRRNVLFRIRSRLRIISPPRITLDPIRQTVEAGQQAYIICTATGDQPIDIQWVPVDRSMPGSVYTADGYIRFNNIHQNDAGKYRCIARNQAGEADSVAEVIVSYRPELHRPGDGAASHRVTSAAGNNVSLVCRPGIQNQGNQVRWTRDNDGLPVNSRLVGTVLEIFDVRKENEGQYYCEIQTPQGLVSDYVILEIGPALKSLPMPLPALHISPEMPEYPVGANVDIRCQSNEPGVIPAWSKLGGGLADNVQNRAGRLTIYNAKTENEGTYRCEATGQQGNYYKDYTLNIKASDDPLRDEVPLQVQRAKRHSSVILECNTDLEEPVSYFWSKQAGSLPFNIDVYSKSIQLNSVGAIDAGTYICTATSQQRTLDIAIVLVVTGIIPYFTQAPNSYITLPTLPDAYLQFSFEISFKPENNYGLILYNGHREKERDGDFISLALDNGVPEFKINLGPGTATTTVMGNETLNERQWHTIKVVRNKKRIIMFVDGKGPFIGENEGKYYGLDLAEPLFLGGVPDYDNISPEVNIDVGLVGCISKFKIGYNFQDILRDALNSTGITNCETCTENKCQHRGTCQEALTTEGYTCICSAMFSGPTCDKRKGEACSPYACGIGKCIDTDYGFQCQCPLGRSGRNCEKTVQVYEPAFRDNAYIAYPPPRPLKRTKIQMRIKPRSVDDGVLLYAAETAEGHGDFISLTIKDRHLEFRFDNGKGAYVIRSDQEIEPNKWSDVVAIRSAQDGRIMIDGHPTTPTRFSNFFKTLTLLTPLYVGGYDEFTVKLNDGVKVEGGFNGCIMDINISGLDDAMMRNITDSSNVEDCANEEDIENGIPVGYQESSIKPVAYDSKKTGCSDNPCRNNAPCIPLSPVNYQCTCPAAFSGKNCEVPLDLCLRQPCQNNGICSFNTTGFTCDCPLGFAGATCQQKIELRTDAQFNGNSWLEFSKSLLPHRNENEAEIIALEFSTNKSEGLIFWHGQGPDQDGQGQDYVSLAVSNGFLEFSYDLGSGPAIIRNTQVKVDDGQKHSVILKRQARYGSVDIDYEFSKEGQSEGRVTSLDCNGNIFLGGAPNISQMTGGKFSSGFQGCIHGFELQQSKTLDLGVIAINGLNVKSCSSLSDIANDIWT